MDGERKIPLLGVLIVDDEALSRMELKTMIDWEKEGFHLIGEAVNGKEGLDLILNHKPDIVVTDIKMPVMDGLQMIEAALSQYDGTQYIVLSSYEEFVLLKTAMQYGVVDYILKIELTSDMLLTVLANTKDALLKHRDEVRNREISPTSKAARTLRRALTNQVVEEDVAAILSCANPAIDPCRLSCIAVRFALPGKNSSFGDDDRRTMELAAHSIIHDIVRQYSAGISFLAHVGLCLFVFTPEFERYESVLEMSRVIINMLRQYLNMASAVGVADTAYKAQDVLSAMNEAVRATDEVFFRGYGKIFRFGNFSESPPKDHATFNWSESYLRALELRRPDKLREVFGLLLSYLSDENKPTKVDAYGLCISVVSLTLSTLKKNQNSKGFFAENIYEIISEIETLAGLREWLDSFQASLLELFSLLTERTGDDYIVIEAKRYIVENCRESISLNKVANHLSISSGYLSSVFKRKAKVGFVEYVTRIKMAEAQNLLLSGKYKIYEVSDLLGYEDPSYFIKTFHKNTGYTPKEYIAKQI